LPAAIKEEIKSIAEQIGKNTGGQFSKIAENGLVQESGISGTPVIVPNFSGRKKRKSAVR